MRDNDLSNASDETLIERARAGSERAFAELWSRHHGAVVAATRSFTGFEAEDIAQEAFARVFAQLRRGGGPATAFRAYLARTARNIAIDMARQAGDVRWTEADEAELAAHATPDHADGVLTGMTMLRAFSSLPTRWQEVLWYRDVEDLPVKECARYVGMSENSTTVLLKRAREGLKQAWIAAHLDTGTVTDATCVWVVERLPRFTRGKSTAGDAARIRAHVDACAVCAAMAEESSHLHRRLALLLLPAFLLGGAPEYLRWIRSGDQRATDLSAQGAVTVPAAAGRVRTPVRAAAVVGAAAALMLVLAQPAAFPTDAGGPAATRQAGSAPVAAETQQSRDDEGPASTGEPDVAPDATPAPNPDAASEPVRLTDGVPTTGSDAETDPAPAASEPPVEPVDPADIRAIVLPDASSGPVAESASAVYDVGPSLRLEFTADGSATRVTAHGLPGSVTWGYRLQYRSSIPELNGSHSYVRSGGNWFWVPLALTAINAPVEFWLTVGDQTSAAQVWTPQP